MKQPLIYLFLASLTVWLGACKQDLGPYKEINRAYSQTNFDRLEMGSGFHVDIRAGSAFSVEVRGNEADVNDLNLNVQNGTLRAVYQNSGRRQHYDTYFTITMPTLRAVDFSGAVQSSITGFKNLNELDILLSGASKSAVNLTTTRLRANLSGASAMDIDGSGTILTSEVSGASKLEAYDFPVTQADVDVSGASNARIRVQDILTVRASGASNVRYQGTPRVNSNVSGASTLAQE